MTDVTSIRQFLNCWAFRMESIVSDRYIESCEYPLLVSNFPYVNTAEETNFFNFDYVKKNSPIKLIFVRENNTQL